MKPSTSGNRLFPGSLPPSALSPTPPVAREVCERTGCAAVLEASIASLGSRYVLGLSASESSTGDVLAVEQAQAARKEDVLDALSRMATAFALAHLQIGRAYALAGDIPKAKSCYQDFLPLWKIADPGIPVLKQAKTEYAKLH